MHGPMRTLSMRTSGVVTAARGGPRGASSSARPLPPDQVTGGTMAEEPLQVVGLPSKLPLELGELPEDALLRICSFLGVQELRRLACVSQRFFVKCVLTPGSSSSRRHSSRSISNQGGGAALEMLSVVEEAARRWVVGRSEQERGWVSWLGLKSWLCEMQQVEMLRQPLCSLQTLVPNLCRGYKIRPRNVANSVPQ
eukprot:COSAG02_NODE_251_length_27002_cov_13.799242_27_plen_196_part_00